MNTILRTGFVFLVLATASVLAAEVPTSSATITSSKKRDDISIDFAGGTLKDCLNTLAGHDTRTINIVAAKSVDLDVPVPAFSLRNASLINVVSALRGLVLDAGMTLDIVGENDQSITCVLTGRPKRHLNVPPQPDQFASFQLEPYLKRYTVDNIVGTIRAAWELDPSRSRDSLQLKFHPGTKILLVSGPQEGIHMASSVISNLHREPDPAPTAEAAPASPPKS